MSILRVNHKARYTVTDNTYKQNPELSFKAKGLLTYLLSLPDSWTPRVSQLATVGPDGEHAVRSALRELEEQGYIHRHQPKCEDGTFGESEVIVYEHPELNPHYRPPEEPHTENPEPVQEAIEEEPPAISPTRPHGENRRLTSTYKTSTIENNNNPPPPKESVVVELADQFKTLTGEEDVPFVAKMLQQHTPEAIRKQLDVMEGYMETREVDNPQGFLRSGLSEGWDLPRKTRPRSRSAGIRQSAAVEECLAWREEAGASQDVMLEHLEAMRRVVDR